MPLGRDQVLQVLRYWLAALQSEASISARPQAHRPGRGAGAQAYVRLAAEHADLVTAGTGVAALAFDDALKRFLDHWLRTDRRRTQLSREGDGPAWSLGWPTFYFAGREELATLIRTPVELEWRRGQAAWTNLGHRTKRAPPPDTLVVRSRRDVGESEEVTVDRDLLSNVLGFLDEEITTLEERWGPRPSQEHVARTLLLTLNADADPEAKGQALIEALASAIAPRLARGVTVWPMAIVQDPGLVHATYHLQNDLVMLIVEGDRSAHLASTSVLFGYVAGKTGKPRRAPMLGRFRARGLTESQRAAGERFLGSTLTAVQGPPGTGKTELILSLAAHTLVERCAALAEGLRMPREQLVVASTNNRAVDNVLDPLGRDLPVDRLPLALRAGNQEVTTTATIEALVRAKHWLEAQPEAGADAALERALQAFRETATAQARLIEPEELRLRQQKRITDLEALIESSVRKEREAEERAKLVEVLDTIDQEVDRMTKIIEAKRGAKKRARVEERWQSLVAAVPPLGDASSPIARALHLPPELAEDADEEEALEAWLDALQEAAKAIEDTKERTPRHTERDRTQRDAWAAELEDLRAKVADTPEVRADPQEVEATAHQLFLDALEVRERWAVANRASLLEALDELTKRIPETRSLKRAAPRRSGEHGALCRLYPIVGTTLLSMGNVFDETGDAIERLVIDEAGQCHPAYPVGGLLRAKSALIIGDVHQLPPVLRLSERDESRAQRAAKIDLADPSLAAYRVHDSSNSSAQRLADLAVEERPTLTDHFRCHPDIIEVSNALAGYGLTVHTVPKAPAIAALPTPVIFRDVDGRQARVRGSWTNPAEAEALADLLAELFADGVAGGDLAIITPYVAQEQLLRTTISARGLSSAGLATGTVHRFQGGERAIVLFSAVVTESRNLPFVDDHPNLLNVAVSRAREHLVIFGRAETLRLGKHTRLLVKANRG